MTSSNVTGITESSTAQPWSIAMTAVLSGRAGMSMLFQPIVDVARRSVVGYEALSRFEGPPNASPDRWFAAAARLGCAPALEAAALRLGLAARNDLPPNCFLTVNVDPNLLLSNEVAAVLHALRPLHNVVFEFTEHAPVDDYGSLRGAIEDIRDAGGKIAIDDTGSGYAGLSHVLALRPELLKLDRQLVSGIEREPAKAALVQFLGEFAGRIDAWILAEGVERRDELRRLQTLGVPLVQGYLLGRPAPAWSGVSADAFTPGPAHDRRRSDVTVSVCMETAPTVPLGTGDEAWFAKDPHLDAIVEIDEWQRPAKLRLRGGTVIAEPQRTRSTVGLAEALDRALTRPADLRFTPLICCDDLGRFIGVVRIDRATSELLTRLREEPGAAGAAQPPIA